MKMVHGVCFIEFTSLKYLLNKFVNFCLIISIGGILTYSFMVGYSMLEHHLGDFDFLPINSFIEILINADHFNIQAIIEKYFFFFLKDGVFGFIQSEVVPTSCNLDFHMIWDLAWLEISDCKR